MSSDTLVSGTETLLPSISSPFDSPTPSPTHLNQIWFDSVDPIPQIAPPRFFAVVFIVLLFGAFLVQLFDFIYIRASAPKSLARFDRERAFIGPFVGLLTLCQATAAVLAIHSGWDSFVWRLVGPDGVYTLPDGTVMYPTWTNNFFYPLPIRYGPVIAGGLAGFLYFGYLARLIRHTSSSNRVFRILAMVITILGVAQLALSAVEVAAALSHYGDATGDQDYDNGVFSLSAFRAIILARSAVQLVAQLIVMYVLWVLFSSTNSTDRAATGNLGPVNAFLFYAVKMGPVLVACFVAQIATALEKTQEVYLPFLFISIPTFGNVVMSWINHPSAPARTPVALPATPAPTSGSSGEAQVQA